jgi:hypothetical protein
VTLSTLEAVFPTPEAVFPTPEAVFPTPEAESPTAAPHLPLSAPAAPAFVYEALTVPSGGPRYVLARSCLDEWRVRDLASAPAVLLGSIVLIQESVAGTDGVEGADYGVANGTVLHIVIAEQVPLPASA